MTGTKIPVTMAAVVQRINRRLAQEEQVLKKSRGGRVRLDFGDYYILDWQRNLLVDSYVDPAALGKELGVLQPWEEVAHEEEAS